jgi:parallel beta-helix repeat protein
MGKLKWHIVLVLALWLVFCGMASATQFYVNETGWWRDGGAFYGSGTPIQAAVNAADNGDSIYVYNGSYTENVGVNKRLTLQGEGADVVIVTAANAEDHVFEANANWMTISGFTVTGAKNMYAKKAGIYLHYADHCSIYGNNASNNVYGIRLSGSSNNNIIADNTVNSNNVYGIYLSPYSGWDYPTNNTFTNNVVNSNADGGIFLTQSTNNTLTDNTVNSNGGDGICLWYLTNNTLTNNIASSNDGCGIYLPSSSDNTLTNNTVNSNEYGIDGYGDGNTLYNNTASSNVCAGICISGSSNTLTNNIANSNDIGIYISHSSTLTNNTVSNNWDGIILSGSSNTLTNNTASSNGDDGIIVLHYSTNNTLTDNTVNSNGGDGIYLDSSSNNTLSTNTINSNDRGIYLSSSSDNIITCNWMQNNTVQGFSLWESTGNNISYNNIIENGNYNATSGGYEWQFYNEQSIPVEAKHNYWGAGMNNSTIDASIYDDEEGAGKVEFYPFKTDPVPCAPISEPELHGDVNHDGKLSTADAVLALQMAVGSIDTDPAADVNCDGRVTSLDALMILQAAAEEA